MRHHTTDLNLVRDNPQRFTWGNVISIMDVGRYTFINFEPNCDRQEAVDVSDETRFAFHIYIDGKDSSHSAGSLDQALVLAISLRNNASTKHSQASAAIAVAACRALNVPVEG